MTDFDLLVEKASPVDSNQAVDHYAVYFENGTPSFDMNARNYSFPKCPDPLCIDRAEHSIELETVLTDPVLELAYDYFLKGHTLRFVKGQCVTGVIERLQKVFDNGGVAYDKSMFFDLRYHGRICQWDSANYLSRMKFIVDPSRKKQFPSLRDIIARTWSEKFPDSIRPACITLIQETMAFDYEHAMSRMRPDYDRDIVNRLAYADRTDVDPNRPWKLDLTVEFVPSQRRKREAAEISYTVSLDFHASTRARGRAPYEMHADDTDVDDQDG